MKILITEQQFNMLKNSNIKMAVIEITIPMAYLSSKYRFQVVPYWKTLEDKIYITKGSAGGKTISTKNIEVLGVFEEDEKEEMKIFLNKKKRNIGKK